MVPEVASVASEPPPADFDEGVFLEAWDPEVRHRSARSARQSGLGRSEADDLAQEVRLALLLAVRAKSGPLNERYVRRITSNVLRSEWRKRSRTEGRNVPIGEVLDIPATEPGSELDPWTRRVTTRRIEALPPRLGTIFNSIYRRGYSQREAARALGMTQPRVAQLHGKLLKWARRELAGIAA
jgi:RNA polymerase sigma factor (sigma-70 family)